MKKNLLKLVLLLLKIGIAYYLMAFLWIYTVLLTIPLKSLSFEPNIYFGSSAVLLLFSSILIIKSPNFFYYTIFSLFLAGIHYLYESSHHLIASSIYFSYTSLFVALFSLIAIFNFIFPYKYTSPVLVILPICSVSLLYLNYVYNPSFLFAAYYFGLDNDLSSTLIWLSNTIEFSVSGLYLSIPPLLLYLLSKNSKYIFSTIESKILTKNLTSLLSRR